MSHTFTRLGRFFLTAAAVLAPVYPAIAQSVPGTADLGRIEREREQQRIVPPSAAATEPVVPFLAAAHAPAEAKNIFLDLKEVTFEGGSVFSKDELESITGSNAFVGKKISLEKAYEFAAAITTEYQRQGWVLSRAIVPPQAIKDGRIKIKLVEGYIASVRTEGDVEDTGIIGAIVRRLSSKQAFNAKELERAVLLLNDLPGVEVKAVLEPLKGNAAVENGIGLALVFKQENKTSAAVSLDNFSSRYVGAYQVGGEVSRTGLTPHGETTLRGVMSTQSKEMKSIALSHMIPLTESGLTLTGYFAHSVSEPGYTLKTTNTESESNSFLARLKQPLIRSREKNLSVSAELAIKNIHADIVNTRLYDDELRVARLGVNFDVFDRYSGANSINVLGSKGFDALGARETGSADLSRAAGVSDFSKVEVNAARLQGVNSWVNVYTSVSAQYSTDVLLSSEQFGFGGQNYGRAYDPSEIVGDKGVAAIVEVRFAGPSFATVTTQPYVFYDIGKVWDNSTGVQPASASSAGVGNRFTLNESVSGVVTVALPLTRDVAAPDYGDGSAPTVTFSLRKEF